MNNELFATLTANAQIGSALLLIAIALWILVFRRMEDKHRSSKSSK